MYVHWWRCEGDIWCTLMTLRLDFPDGGVYVIWDRETGVVVYVGQGEIAKRLEQHRADPAITGYGAANLLVTWAEVSPVFRDGIERFLADQYRPLEGVRHPDVTPISVNLPQG